MPTQHQDHQISKAQEANCLIRLPTQTRVPRLRMISSDMAILAASFPARSYRSYVIRVRCGCRRRRRRTRVSFNGLGRLLSSRGNGLRLRHCELSDDGVLKALMIVESSPEGEWADVEVGSRGQTHNARESSSSNPSEE